MKERPILFSGPMIRALRSGTKTQTRRVLKQATGPSLSVGMSDDDAGVAELSWLWGDGPGYDVNETIKRVACPYGQPGDRLWVRETHAPQPDCSLSWDRWMKGHGGEKPIIHYAADASERAWVDKWRPSIHMPRWASRITLEVTGVRVERLHDISEEDARAEGITDGGCLNCGNSEADCGCLNPRPDARDSFVRLWQSINGPESWAANPWVWVVNFKVLP